MRNNAFMKYAIPIMLLTFLSNEQILAQLAGPPHLDVEGHVKIRGNIDIHNAQDSTTTFIGIGAGNAMTYDSENSFSTHVGSNAGLSNGDGFNSFFGAQAGMNSSGDQNSFFGARAGENNGGGFNNSFFGVQAGFNNSDVSGNSFFGAFAGRSNEQGASNSFFGANAGEMNMDANNNSFFGSTAGKNNLSGSGNSFFGSFAGEQNSSGSDNSFFGESTGSHNQTGKENSFFGKNAGFNNEDGDNNSFFGYEAGFNNQTGNSNSIFGKGAGFNNISGGKNIFIGFSSGQGNVEGFDNTYVGAFAGFSNLGSRNTFIGSNAGEIIYDTLTQSIALGYNATVSGSHCAVIGGEGDDAVKVGIGLSKPTQVLDINGNARIRAMPDLPSGTLGASPVYINLDGTLAKSSSGTISDRRLKEDIKELQGALDQVTKLRGYSYYFKSDSSQTRQIGVMAQELERAYPELVLEDPESGYKRVQYPQLTAVLIQAIKEQQQQIELLKAKVQALEDQN